MFILCRIEFDGLVNWGESELNSLFGFSLVDCLLLWDLELVTGGNLYL